MEPSLGLPSPAEPRKPAAAPAPERTPADPMGGRARGPQTAPLDGTGQEDGCRPTTRQNRSWKSRPLRDRTSRTETLRNDPGRGQGEGEGGQAPLLPPSRSASHSLPLLGTLSPRQIHTFLSPRNLLQGNTNALLFVMRTKWFCSLLLI